MQHTECLSRFCKGVNNTCTHATAYPNILKYATMCKGRNAKEIRRIHEKFRFKNKFVQVLVKSKKGQKNPTILTVPNNNKFTKNYTQ